MNTVLNPMYKHTETYSSRMHYFSEVTLFWPIRNNQPVVDVISKLNARKRAPPTATYTQIFHTIN